MPQYQKKPHTISIVAKYLRYGVILSAVALLSACYRGPKLNQNCEFAMQDQIPAVATPKAVEIYELAKAYDGSIYRTNQMPEPGPPVDPKYAHIEEDRVKARELYKQAAELGHVDAMYRLATFMVEGLGLPNDGYEPDYDGAYYWFKEVARRDDPFGYYALANFYLYGIDRRADVKTGEQCLVQAAKRGLMQGQISLAELDLGLLEGFRNAPANPPHRIERGLRLLEDSIVKGHLDSYVLLSNYYVYADPNPLKAEYYAWAGTVVGNERAHSRLRGRYSSGGFSEINKNLSECILNVGKEDFARIETLCPRPDGPLTRKQAGLPPAPTAPLDVRAYLEDYQQRHSDQ